MVNMKLHLNSPRNWADRDQCNVENSRIAKIQGYLRPKDMPGPRMWSKYARYLCIACQCWQRQSPHQAIFIRQTRPIVPSLLGWHELLATSPESQRLQRRRCFTVFYSGLVNKRNLWVQFLHVLNRTRKVETFQAAVLDDKSLRNPEFRFRFSICSRMLKIMKSNMFKVKNRLIRNQVARHSEMKQSVELDDGWPESVEEQGLHLLVCRHHITKQYIRDEI